MTPRYAPCSWNTSKGEEIIYRAIEPLAPIFEEPPVREGGSDSDICEFLRVPERQSCSLQRRLI